MQSRYILVYIRAGAWLYRSTDRASYEQHRCTRAEPSRARRVVVLYRRTCALTATEPNRRRAARAHNSQRATDFRFHVQYWLGFGTVRFGAKQFCRRVVERTIGTRPPSELFVLGIVSLLVQGTSSTCTCEYAKCA